MLILVQFQVIMKNHVKQKKQLRELLSCCCIRAGTLELVIQEKQEQLDESYIICMCQTFPPYYHLAMGQYGKERSNLQHLC